MKIRPYQREDEAALAALSATCARGEGDFVLNPIWENADEFKAEFERFGIDPESHVIVAEEASGETVGSRCGFSTVRESASRKGTSGRSSRSTFSVVPEIE